MEWLKGHEPLLSNIGLSDMFPLSINYALAVGKDKPEDIIDAFLGIYPQYKETIMTAARQLERKGKQEGKQERNIEVARNMHVNLHFDLATIQKVTELTKEELQGILKEIGDTSKSK